MIQNHTRIRHQNEDILTCFCFGSFVGKAEPARITPRIPKFRVGLDLWDRNPLISNKYAQLSAVWSLLFKKDIVELEYLQRWATKVMYGSGELQYPKRWSKFWLFRWLKGILITMDKYIIGKCYISHLVAALSSCVPPVDGLCCSSNQRWCHQARCPVIEITPEGLFKPGTGLQRKLEKYENTTPPHIYLP